MSKVLVDRELLERTVKHLEWDGDGSQTVMQYAQQGDSLAGELEQAMAQPAEAEGVDLQQLAAEFDAAPDDAEWEPPHPIFQMARDLDRVTAALSAVTAERDRLLASKLYWVAPAGSGLVRCVTDERYRKFSPSIRAKYDPVCCVDTAMAAKEGC